ncbi:MAG: hypothetical protein LWX11_06555, partial [Firmicutes bacterium]|nr:hypothetical protein [Bacillota bacterium]
LAISYLSRYDLAQVEPEQLVKVNGGSKPESQAVGAPAPNGMTPLFPEAEAPTVIAAPEPPSGIGHGAHPKQDISAYQAAREKGYTGDPCPECGHLTLVRNGACLKCQTCGCTTGCS